VQEGHASLGENKATLNEFGITIRLAGKRGRAAKLPGIRAFLFDAFPETPYWDESYEPFWAVANDLGYPIHFHIGSGNLGSFGGGLQPLPNFVRRPRRVSLWVIAKVIINGMRICKNHGLRS